MRRREFLSGLAGAQVLGLRSPVPADEHALAAPIHVAGKCPIPGCGTHVDRTLRDVGLREIKGPHYVLLICTRCGCAFGVEVGK